MCISRCVREAINITRTYARVSLRVLLAFLPRSLKLCRVFSARLSSLLCIQLCTALVSASSPPLARRVRLWHNHISHFITGIVKELIHYKIIPGSHFSLIRYLCKLYSNILVYSINFIPVLICLRNQWNIMS